jgi:hypothetical protein
MGFPSLQWENSMESQSATASHHGGWNKGKLIGRKATLKLKKIRAIRNWQLRLPWFLICASALQGRIPHDPHFCSMVCFVAQTFFSISCRLVSRHYCGSRG